MAIGAVALAQEAPPPEAPPAVERIPPDLLPFQGRLVRRIAFEVPGAKPDDAPTPLSASEEELARNQLRQGEGLPFDAVVISQDVSRLNRLGRYKRVEANVQLLADGSVELIYRVQLQPLITAVQSVGNRLFDDDELVGGFESLVGAPVDPTVLERAARRIEDQYKAKGYFNTRVTVDQEELENSGIVLFRVREGERTRITGIQFEGANSFTERQLKRQIKTREAWLIDILRESGVVDNDKLDEDVGALIQFYKDRGHLDVRVDRSVTPSADGRQAIVTFYVEEGPVYTIRDIQVRVREGEDPIFTAEQLTALLDINPGDVYGDDRVRRAIKAISDAYGSIGYADAEVVRQVLREPDRPIVDVRLLIRQGNRYRLGVVEIRGNTTTRSDVIREQVTVQTDRPVDTTEIEETTKRIERMRLFTPRSVKMNLQPEKDEEPGYRDALIEVEETNTGSFSIGAGVSSDSGVSARIILQERNFDITDLPDSMSELFRGEAFRGGGQTMTLQALPGNEVTVLSASLSDPYAFGTPFSASASAYYRDRIYDSYDENRIGAGFSVGRQFGSRWRLSIPFGVEQIGLSDIDADAPTDYFAVADDNVLYNVGFRLTRQTLDNLAFPSKGTNIEFGAAVYGGDFNFMRLDTEYSRFFKLDEDALGLKTVLQLTGRASYIPGDSDDVPFYERLYMGGQNFRGFDYRAVAPVGIRNDNGQPSEDTVGGNWLFFAGAEIRKPLLTELLSGVLFIDTGTVSEDISFSEYRVSVGFGFRIYVEALSQIPLAFDFGFPIMKEDTDDTSVFSFSIDLPFN